MNNKPAIQLTVTGHPVRMQGAAYIPRSIQALQVLTAWRKEQSEAPDAWLRQDIGKAFQHFLGLRLINAPAVEMLPIVAEEWVDVIGEGMTEHVDRERIRQGLNLMRRTLKWWPQPADLLKVLPRRQTNVNTVNNVHNVQQSDEDHAASAAKFQEILDALAGGMKVQNPEQLDRQGVEKMKRDFLTRNNKE